MNRDQAQSPDDPNHNGHGVTLGDNAKPPEPDTPRVWVPAVTTHQRSPMPRIHLPDSKPSTSDRQGRREAQEQRRALARIVDRAMRGYVKLQAVREVNVAVVAAVDRGQHEMMEILNGRPRQESMDEHLASVVSHSLHQMEAQMQAIAEHHYRCQAEED